MVNVVIATPGDIVTMSYLNCLMDTIKELDQRGISYEFVSAFDPNLYIVRSMIQNNIVNNIKDYDKVIWIDNDIRWTPEDFMKLYESDKDIIGGVYRYSPYSDKLSSCLTPNNWESVESFLSAGRTDPYKVHSTGFGFVSMKRGILESLPNAFFKGFDFSERLSICLGEDTLFYNNALIHGFEIWIDPTIKLGHLKRSFI